MWPSTSQPSNPASKLPLVNSGARMNAKGKCVAFLTSRHALGQAPIETNTAAPAAIMPVTRDQRFHLRRATVALVISGLCECVRSGIGAVGGGGCRARGLRTAQNMGLPEVGIECHPRMTAKWKTAMIQLEAKARRRLEREFQAYINGRDPEPGPVASSLIRPEEVVVETRASRDSESRASGREPA